jgi:hypothetical protein
VPNPPFSYVVSFIRFHERGFAAPASRFMRALCHHYGVEMHNFTPNVISQAATFVGVCEGFLGISVNWDLWSTSSARSCTFFRFPPLFFKKEHVLILAHYTGLFTNMFRKKRKITKKLNTPVHRDGIGYPKPEYPTSFTR